MSDNPYVALTLAFAPLSLVAFGGGVSVLPAVQHQAVDLHGWVDAQQFLEFFAISRTAPGPGLMLTTLIGWQVAGWVGALVAMLAIFVPSSLVCLVVMRTLSRHEGKSWHAVVHEGLAPVGTGLVGAGVLSLFRIADAGPASWLVAAATGAVMLARPQIPPMLLLMAAGALFAGWSFLSPT
ncbi:chromate transporter [Ancylobacter sp. TS-1]|uniref:chromate transporter n=1 Tax=Ancylobacter sp. TS-1 TaxID=1850374 RepID=UPI001265CEF2|nr:chromate transporter [Ancylobacter sp. TS-1]QFR32660.1 chromate transporter [Ancylobacter sp. TS-1]